MNNLQQLLEEFEKHYQDFELGRKFDHKAIFREVITQAYTLGKEEGERLQKMDNEINNSKVF